MADGGDAFGKYGAALGSGAANLGKKAAQSEAGRSAGRAAVTGAAEGVKQDLSNRYLAPGEAGTPQPSPAPQPQPKPSGNVAASSSSQTQRSQESALQHHSGNQEPRPPKPSRFKPHIGKAADKKPAHQLARRQSNKRLVYKYNLSKEANWEEKMLVQALYNFKAERKCDLEFRKGQIIQVLTRTDNQFDWWEGKLEDRVGIFPANYVKAM